MSYERSMLLDAESPPELDEHELEALDEMAADAAYERMRDRQDERASVAVSTESVETAEHAPYDISGIVVLHDDTHSLEINAEIRIHDGAVSITKADGSPIASTARVQATHPAAIRYVDALANELHKVGYQRPSRIERPA